MKKQHGGTILGLILGVVFGLAAALTVAVYVTKTPPTLPKRGRYIPLNRMPMSLKRTKTGTPTPRCTAKIQPNLLFLLFLPPQPDASGNVIAPPVIAPPTSTVNPTTPDTAGKSSKPTAIVKPATDAASVVRHLNPR